MKKIATVCCFVISCFWQSCKEDQEPPVVQSPVYTIEPEKFGIRLNETTEEVAYANTTGITEALAYAQAFGYDTVRFPKANYYIASDWHTVTMSNPTNGISGIIVPSDLVVDLGASTFRLHPNDHPHSALFFLYDVDNITLMGGHLIGDRLLHDYSDTTSSKTHEFGHGVRIAHSNHILIKDMKIEHMTGDAVTIGGMGKYNNSCDVIVTNCELFDCRRQGITISGVNGCEVSYNTIYRIGGTHPQAGIDVEVQDYHEATHIKIHHNHVSETLGGTIVCLNGEYIDIYDNTVKTKIISIQDSYYVNVYDNILINTYLKIVHPERVNAWNNQTVKE